MRRGRNSYGCVVGEILLVRRGGNCYFMPVIIILMRQGSTSIFIFLYDVWFISCVYTSCFISNFMHKDYVQYDKPTSD